MKLLPKGDTPRWVILISDIVLCLVALTVAYFIRFDFVTPGNDVLAKEWEVLRPSILIYIVVRIALFVLLDTYRGIIRYTSTQDAKRLFFALIFGSGLFALASLVRSNYLDGMNFLPTSILIIEFMLSLLLLICMRVIIKLLYIEETKARGSTKNLIIYGAGEMGLATKRILESDARTVYNVVAFIDDNPTLSKKTLERTRIYHTNELEKLIQTNSPDGLLIAINYTLPPNKRRVVSTCIEMGVETSTVPPLKKWTDGTFDSAQIKKVKIEDLLGRDEIKLDHTEISTTLKNKRVLVTGAAGSIGSEISRQIMHYSPAEVILLDQSESPLYELQQDLYGESNVSFTVIIADICDEVRMEQVFLTHKPDIVFHAAAYKHVPLMENNPEEAVRTNIMGTQLLSSLADRYELEKFVMVSTDKAVNPTNVMGASKRVAEIYTQTLNQSSKTQFITTRFGNVLGSNGSVIPLFRKQIEKGGPVTVTDERITRYFMTIPEACELVLEAGAMGKGGEIYLFDMGESVKIIDLATQMIKLSGLEPNKDIQIEITGLRPGEKLYEELLNNEENALPTHHEKIMIGKVREYHLEEVNRFMEDLKGYWYSSDTSGMVKKIKELVPEYISNNSVYSKFDKQ